MSAANWLSDAHPYQNGENAAFNGAADPSMVFLQTPTTASFDFNQIQTQQLQQRMQNGVMANGSPAPPSSMYQTQTSIPSKRPRPREDSLSGSPRPYAGALPVSRSQTPHGSYPVNGASFPGGNPYQTMQQNANTTNQSPALQPQNFNSHNTQQRVQTMSPSPFSPAAQNFANHTSPPHSEHGSRVNTPHNNGPQFPNNTPYTMGNSQPYMPQNSSTMNGIPPNQYSQNQQHEQMMMEARMRQMGQMGALRGGAIPQGVPFNPMSQVGNSMSNIQMAQMRAQQAQQAQPRSQPYQQMLQNITNFTRQRGLPFNPQPNISGNPVNSVQLFHGVLKMGGSKKISVNQLWPRVATLLGYHQMQCMAAAQELQSYWQTNLADFESHYLQHQHQQQIQQQHRQRAMADPMRAAASLQPGDTGPRPSSFSPPKAIHDQGTRFMQPPSSVNAAYQTPTKQNLPPQATTRHPILNGHTESQKAQHQAASSNLYGQPPSAIAEQPLKETVRTQSLALSRATSKNRRPKGEDSNYLTPRQRRSLTEMYVPKANNLDVAPRRKPGEDDLPQETRQSSHGGLPVEEKGFTDTVESLLKFKLRAPLLEELGPIDVRALTLSIRSGIGGEVRHALDTVASLSISLNKTPPSLDQCDDLVESMVECANDQVELLAEHATEVSDAMLINSYEDTVKGCKVEVDEIQGFADFGTLEYNLNKAVDRLICITTIFRNFAFFEASHRALTDPIVLKMMTTVIRHLGTRNMMLRTHQNTLDFVKDVVVFLSQTAHRLDFQNKDEALCVLHFLVSFAPLPEPNDGNGQHITFSSYTPSLNRYLPHAVDALAKLLTREPNRTFCRSIFAADSTASPPFDLLTRAFGLAISPVPDLEDTIALSMITYRIPFMVQGLLAAEILVSMIPNSEHELALSWLESQDNFASRLMRMLALLSYKLPALPLPQPHIPPPPKESIDQFGYIMVTNRGLIVLKRLIERAKDADLETNSCLNGVLPNKQTVVRALSTSTMDSDVLRHLCALYGLDI